MADRTCQSTSEIPSDIRTRIPWTTAIYFKPTQNSKFRYLITGTIVGPSTVLTVFRGGYGMAPNPNSKKFEIFPPESLLVGGGLLSTNLNTIDEFAQLKEVWLYDLSMQVKI